MKTIALSGTGRGCGKTTVGTFIAEQFTDMTAVKVTAKHKTTLGEADFDVETLPSNEGDAVIVSDPEILLTRGTDTRRYWDVGCEPVCWIRARDEGVLEAVNEAVVAAGATPGGPGLVIVESGRYVALDGDTDVALFVYANGTTNLPDEAFEALANSDAIVITKRRPGPVHVPMFDDQRYPQDKLDLPVYAYNLDNDNLSLDDRYRMTDWMTEKLDLTTVTNGASNGASGGDTATSLHI